MKNSVLNPLLSETLAKRHQMHSDVDKLAKRDKFRTEWIGGSAIQPPDTLRRIAFVALSVFAGVVWFFVGAGLAGEF